MRFATAVVALAGAVSAYEYNAEYPAPDSTVYSTDYVTVTSSYVDVKSTVYPVTTSAEAPVVPYPSKYFNSTSAAVPTYPPKEYPVPSYPAGGDHPVPSYPAGGPGKPYPPVSLSTAAPACPTYSVKTVVEDVTTVIQTTKYETVEVPCATPTPSGYPVPSSNATGTYAAPPPTYTAGASTMGASVILAAAAGLAALLL
ncbi:hypothetical protein V8F20_003734 [Naviculisporaceae sp. PSN 640]